MLRMHFLNVGHGDCCIIEFPEHTTMVDINRSQKMDDKSVKEVISAIKIKHPDRSLRDFDENVDDPDMALKEAGYDLKPQDPIQYLEENNINSFFRFISTHPHMDHLKDFGKLTESADISNVWIVKNSFGPDKQLQKQSRISDWNTYVKLRNSDSTAIKETGTPETDVLRAEENSLDDFYKTDGIKILSPNPELLKTAEDDDNPNVMSYVLLIEYGPHKIVLGGDAEKENWKYILDQYKDLIKDVTVLKAAHHGRTSGFYEEAVRHMNPEYTIVSVGNTLKPKVDASQKYKEITRNFLTTRWKGNIVLECHENGEINCITQYN